MADSILTLILSVANIVVVSVVAGFGIWKATHEVKNLRGSIFKGWLDLIDEAERRVQRDSIHLWRYPETPPPRGSFEDSYAKDLLASQIFGREITWEEWLQIRKFLAEHANVRIYLLRLAWPYRVQQENADGIRFEMTRQVRWAWLIYEAITWVMLLLFVFGFMLVAISLNYPLKWLISLTPQIQKLLNFLDIHTNHELFVVGANLIPLPLLTFIWTVHFNYGGYAARRIWKRTRSRPKK